MAAKRIARVRALTVRRKRTLALNLPAGWFRPSNNDMRRKIVKEIVRFRIGAPFGAPTEAGVRARR